MANRIIRTVGIDGQPNGTVIPIWHVDGGLPIEQVYLTTILPGKQKGPHLHLKRRGLFCLLRGQVKIVKRQASQYQIIHAEIGELVHVPPGVACALYNVGSDEALLLNMPSPPWRADDPDEWPVDAWTYQAAIRPIVQPPWACSVHRWIQYPARGYQECAEPECRERQPIPA